MFKISAIKRASFELLVKAFRLLKASKIKVESEHYALFKKLCDDTLKAIDHWFLDLAREKGIPEDQIPEGFTISGMITGIIYKSGLRGADIEEVQAWIFSQLADWIERYDPNSGKFTNMLYRNIKSRIADYKAERAKDVGQVSLLTEEEEGGGGVPIDLIEDVRETANSESEFKNLVAQISDYLHNKKEKLGKVFDMLFSGLTAQQIQETLGISRGYVSQIMEEMRKSIVDFAQDAGNEELEQAAEAIRKKYFVRSSFPSSQIE